MEFRILGPLEATAGELRGAGVRALPIEIDLEDAGIEARGPLHLARCKRPRRSTKPARRPTPIRVPAVSIASCSLSMTQVPAIRKTGW